jgi:predicted nucleic acid-binding protein
VRIDAHMIPAAIARSRSQGFSLWDALIVEAALRAGVRRLLTEDLQYGQRIGNLTVENPFGVGG